MFTDSKHLDQLHLFANSPWGDSFYLYGDPANPLRIHLQAPFRARALTPLMMDFSKSMSTVRESVEWLFNDIATYFKFIDFKKWFVQSSEMPSHVSMGIKIPDSLN